MEGLTEYNEERDFISNCLTLSLSIWAMQSRQQLLQELT